MMQDLVRLVVFNTTAITSASTQEKSIKTRSRVIHKHALVFVHDKHAGGLVSGQEGKMAAAHMSK